MKKGTIYKITNLVNGKVYLGQTTQEFNKRMNQHKYELNTNRHHNNHLQSAWDKYGEESFSFEMILTCTIDDLDKYERYWIEFYHSMNSKHGYNKEAGGNSNKKQSKETRNKMSKLAKHRAADVNHRLFLSKISKKAWKDGKYENRLNQLKEQSHNFICINTQEIFTSATEMSEKLQINIKSIYSACNGMTESVLSKDGRRYQVSYYEAGKKYELKDLMSHKKVICLTTGKIFSSITEAESNTTTTAGNIVKACKGELKATGTLHDGTPLQWAYYEKGKEYQLLDSSKLRLSKKVICINTKEIFENAANAGKKYNIKSSTISAVCRGNKKTAGTLPNGTPLQWSFYEEGKDYFLKDISELRISKKQVICIHTGEVFENAGEAGKKFNIRTAGISNVCKGKTKSAGKLLDGTKLSWAYYDDYLKEKTLES
jgi:group I intron endonuclease